jgi:hypothetical protein
MRPAQRFTLFYVVAVSRDGHDFQRFDIVAKLAAALETLRRAT